MPYRTHIEFITGERVILRRSDLVILLNYACGRISGGRPFHYVSTAGVHAELRSIGFAELASELADDVFDRAHRFVLPLALEPDDAAAEAVRALLSDIRRINRAMAEKGLRRALEELVRLRAMIGLDQAES